MQEFETALTQAGVEQAVLSSSLSGVRTAVSHSLWRLEG